MTTRIIVAKGLRTSKALQERICRQNHVLDLLDTAILPPGDLGDILHDTLCSLCLPSARFPRYNNTLVLVVGVHVVISTLCYAEDMWRNFEPILPSIFLKCFLSVDAEVFKRELWGDQIGSKCPHTSERIDRYKHSSDVGVYLSVGPSLLEVVVDALIADSR